MARSRNGPPSSRPPAWPGNAIESLAKGPHIAGTPASFAIVLAELLVRNTVAPMAATKGIVQHDMPAEAEG
jgi:hypothetical protein